jgi:hypothetical protein
MACYRGAIVNLNPEKRFTRKKWAILMIAALVVGGAYGFFSRPKRIDHARKAPAISAPQRQTASVGDNASDGLTDEVVGVRAPIKSRLPFVTVVDSRETPVEIMQHIGVTGLRVREVKIDTGVLVENESDERSLKLNPFDDIIISAVLYPSSQLDVNHSFLSGSIVGDPAGQIALAISGGVVSGTITTGRAKYRVVSSGKGTHYIVELKP